VVSRQEEEKEDREWGREESMDPENKAKEKDVRASVKDRGMDPGMGLIEEGVCMTGDLLLMHRFRQKY
jgi:hypothetical protein